MLDSFLIGYAIVITILGAIGIYRAKKAIEIIQERTRQRERHIAAMSGRMR